MSEQSMSESTHRPDPRDLLLIVVGAHPEAERLDRALGYRLRERILRWQDEAPCEWLLQPLVCTDLWYLNDADLQSQPTICLGDPELNAASAYFATRLPDAFVIDETLRVQMDQTYVDLRALIRGEGFDATVSAVDLFAERYLDAFLRAAHELPVEP